jgi:hypothetical protein
LRPATRIALLAAVVVIAVVGFIVLKPDDDDETSSSAGAGTPTTETTATTETGGGKAEKPEKPEQPPSPPIANVRVNADGQPVGGVRELEFGKGQRVQFVVDSQVEDHVHVHGYDIMRDVAPGKPTKFSFEGDIDGQFEVELEDRAVEIISLRVVP